MEVHHEEEAAGQEGDHANGDTIVASSLMAIVDAPQDWRFLSVDIALVDDGAEHNDGEDLQEEGGGIRLAFGWFGRTVSATKKDHQPHLGRNTRDQEEGTNKGKRYTKMYYFNYKTVSSSSCYLCKMNPVEDI